MSEGFLKMEHPANLFPGETGGLDRRARLLAIEVVVDVVAVFVCHVVPGSPTKIGLGVLIIDGPMIDEGPEPARCSDTGSAARPR